MMIVPSMLGTALSLIEQSTVTLAAMVVLTTLAANGLLPGFLASLIQPGGILEVFNDPLYRVTLLSAAIVSTVVVLLVVVIGGGFVYSAEYSIYLEAWNHDMTSFSSIIEKGRRYWKPMAWTFFLANLITWGPVILAYGIVLVAATSARTLQGIFILLVSSYFLEFALLGSLILALFTIYAYPAVVVSQTSGMRAIKNSFRVASHNLGTTFTYAAVRVIFQVLLTAVVLSAGMIGIPLASFSAAILTLVLTPILHSTKTMIYYFAEPDVPEVPFQLSNPIWRDIARRLPRSGWLKIKAGLVETGKFLTDLRSTIFHLSSILGLIVGILLGIYVANNGIVSFLLSHGYRQGRINPLVLQTVPPILGLDIFLNNWLVSIATGLAGLGFGVPSFATIMFNGFLLGIVLQLSPTITMFNAAILPHGIIEIPSFILAGSTGIKLGYAALKAKLSPSDENYDYLSKVLRQTVYVLVGLAPLFFIAGLIEADLTPTIMRMFGWT